MAEVTSPRCQGRTKYTNANAQKQTGRLVAAYVNAARRHPTAPAERAIEQHYRASDNAVSSYRRRRASSHRILGIFSTACATTIAGQNGQLASQKAKVNTGCHDTAREDESRSFCPVKLKHDKSSGGRNRCCHVARLKCKGEGEQEISPDCHHHNVNKNKAKVERAGKEAIERSHRIIIRAEVLPRRQARCPAGGESKLQVTRGKVVSSQRASTDSARQHG